MTGEISLFFCRRLLIKRFNFNLQQLSNKHNRKLDECYIVHCTKSSCEVIRFIILVTSIFPHMVSVQLSFLYDTFIVLDYVSTIPSCSCCFHPYCSHLLTIKVSSNSISTIAMTCQLSTWLLCN